jgi:hypothetical protein
LHRAHGSLKPDAVQPHGGRSAPRRVDLLPNCVRVRSSQVRVVGLSLPSASAGPRMTCSGHRRSVTERPTGSPKYRMRYVARRYVVRAVGPMVRQLRAPQRRLALLRPLCLGVGVSRRLPHRSV